MILSLHTTIAVFEANTPPPIQSSFHLHNDRLRFIFFWIYKHGAFTHQRQATAWTMSQKGNFTKDAESPTQCICIWSKLLAHVFVPKNVKCMKERSAFQLLMLTNKRKNITKMTMGNIADSYNNNTLRSMLGPICSIKRTIQYQEPNQWNQWILHHRMWMKIWDI